MRLGSGPIKGSLVCAAVAMALSAGVAGATNAANDPLFPQQWALAGDPSSINAPGAWACSTGAGVTIASLDTGADFSQEDLAGKLVAGAQFLSGNGSVTGTGTPAVSDDNGHGTETTGLMVADTNNHKGIAGVAPDAKALVIKVMDSSGRGSIQDIAAGLAWAVSKGANVVNISLEPLPYGTDPSPLVQAIRNAAQHNVAVALAAGNTSLNSGYSSVTDVALVVGALDKGNNNSAYSSSGANIWAPGGAPLTNQIISTGMNNTYPSMSGTSMAAPQVAGTLALIMAKTHDAAGARRAILASSRNPTGGYNELDAAGAAQKSGACDATAASTGAGGPLGLGGGSSVPGSSSGTGGGGAGDVHISQRSYAEPDGGGATSAPGASPTLPGQQALGIREEPQFRNTPQGRVIAFIASAPGGPQFFMLVGAAAIAAAAGAFGAWMRHKGLV